MLIAIVAFVAALGGVWTGRELFPSPPSPGVELHSLLHDGLELDDTQKAKLEMLESRFAVRRRALELELKRRDPSDRRTGRMRVQSDLASKIGVDANGCAGGGIE